MNPHKENMFFRDDAKTSVRISTQSKTSRPHVPLNQARNGTVIPELPSGAPARWRRPPLP